MTSRAKWKKRSRASSGSADIRRRHRQGDREDRPLAGTAGDLDLSALQLGEGADQRQPQAQAALAELVGPRRVMDRIEAGEERLEHARPRRLVHADALVAHGDDEVALGGATRPAK